MDEQQGLYGKYTVTKTATGEAVTDCFVLRPDRDTAARAALLAYAEQTDDGLLAEALYAWWDRLNRERFATRLPRAAGGEG